MPIADVTLAYCEELCAIARRPRTDHVATVLACRLDLPDAVADHLASRQPALWPALARNVFVAEELWIALGDVTLRHGAGARTASWLAAVGTVRGFSPERVEGLTAHAARLRHVPPLAAVTAHLDADVDPLPRGLLEAADLAPRRTSEKVRAILGDEPDAWEALIALITSADDPELFPVQGATFVKRAAQAHAARNAAAAARNGAAS
jgi:hypothetical protein